MLMRLWRFLIVVVVVVVVFLEKATVVRKISHESKYHKSQQKEKKVGYRARKQLRVIQ